MNKRLLVLTHPALASLPGPYTLPAALPDGPFPAGWTGASWTISSAKGVCSPTLGSELFTDPGLEATYTAGKCDSLSTVTTPTLAQSADVHGGSKAQQFTADANNENVYQLIVPVANTWYLCSAWGKRTAGAAGEAMLSVYQASSVPLTTNYSPAYSSASYAQRKVAKRSLGTGNFFLYAAIQIGVTGYDTVIIDDCSIKAITQSTMFALRKARSNATVKAKYTWNRDGVCGVVARANLASNPSTFLVAYYMCYNHLYTYCILEKCVAGTWTTLISDWSNSPSAGGGDTPTATQWLEIRCNGNTVQLFHNNSQVGTDQTVTDVSGNYAGVFQSGGSQLESFFVG